MPKRPPNVAAAGCAEAPEAAEVVVADWDAAGVVPVAGLFIFENKPDEPLEVAALPKRPAAGFEASAGGAPAGVVEGSENKGLAGVDAPAAENALAPPS